MISFFIALAIAYLLGSISTSIIVSKIYKTPDPRTEGSGNAGATNMLRIAGKKQAAIVLIGDALKGLIAVWLAAHILHIKPFGLAVVALVAVVGHIFPLYHKFEGGKGVATAIGGVLALSFISGILMIAVWVAIVLVTRFSSLASMATVVLAPVFLLIFAKAAFFIPTALMAALIVWKHAENITKLKAGTESKIVF